ncbi:hypothetical protein M405DRAFT_318710 [Rhizopogon salebrosus TDB-379]|nr:hypothetical protein M405DRAFT_318710 [Rhizopogon salebrosus TDB-379]
MRPSRPPLLISCCSPQHDHPPPILYLSGVRPSSLVVNCAITAHLGYHHEARQNTRELWAMLTSGCAPPLPEDWCSVGWRGVEGMREWTVEGTLEA